MSLCHKFSSLWPLPLPAVRWTESWTESRPKLSFPHHVLPGNGQNDTEISSFTADSHKASISSVSKPTKAFQERNAIVQCLLQIWMWKFFFKNNTNLLNALLCITKCILWSHRIFSAIQLWFMVLKSMIDIPHINSPGFLHDMGVEGRDKSVESVLSLNFTQVPGIEPQLPWPISLPA